MKNILLLLGQHDITEINSAPKVRTYCLYNELKKQIPTVLITGSRLARMFDLIKYLLTNNLRVTKYVYLEPATSSPTPIDLLFLILCYINNIPIAVFVRDVHQLYKNQCKVNSVKTIILFYGWKIAVNIYCSIADILYFPTKEMSAYIHFHTKKLMPPGGILRENIKQAISNKKEKIIIYIGGNEPFYGIDIFVEAMKLVTKKHSDAVCYIISKGDFSYLGEARGEKWLHIQQANFNEIDKIMSKAYLAVSPLRKNGYGGITIALKMYDYMSYGKPIIATSCPPQERFIQENKCGILVEDTSASMADGICYLLDNPKLNTELGKNGLDALKKHHLWKHRAEQIISDLSNVKIKK